MTPAQVLRKALHLVAANEQFYVCHAIRATRVNTSSGMVTAHSLFHLLFWKPNRIFWFNSGKMERLDALKLAIDIAEKFQNDLPEEWYGYACLEDLEPLLERVKAKVQNESVDALSTKLVESLVRRINYIKENPDESLS